MDPLPTEQRAGNLALTRSILQGVVDAEQTDAATDPRVVREKRPSEPAMAMKMQQPAKGQEGVLGRYDPVQHIKKMDRRRTDQPALDNVETDVMPAIRQDRMVPSGGSVGHNRQPRRDALHFQAIGIVRIGRRYHDRQRARIEIGMPKDPGRRRGPVRIFSENAAPIGADRARCRR